MKAAGSVKAAKWRPTTATDLEAIQTIANVVHPDLSERREIFAEKLRLFSEGCFVFVEDGAILGYAFVHPWLLNNIPKLNEFLLRIPSKPDCLLNSRRGYVAASARPGRSESFARTDSEVGKGARD